MYRVRPQFQAVSLEDDCWRSGRYGYASGSSLPSRKPPHPFRVSLAREVLREIRNLFVRIAKLRAKQLDRQGISLEPLSPQLFPLVLREKALSDCTQDMRSLYTDHRRPTLTDLQLFAQAWKLGAEWSARNARSELV